MGGTRLACAFLFAAFLPHAAIAWKDWTTKNQPNPRTGHSMSEYENQIFLFGGRSRNEQQMHRPKTYDIVTVAGQLEFANYDQTALVNCTGVNSDICDTYPNVSVAVYLNDIWTYNLSCTREDDQGCEDSETAWRLVDSGAPSGGCLFIEGSLQCTRPFERYNHAAAMLGKGNMVIYGGYSPWCDDYCDDVWVYETRRGLWGKLERGINDETPYPGKRWKATSDNSRNVMYTFGGHRLWHGYGAGTGDYPAGVDPIGGYLSDFWTLRLSAENSQHTLRSILNGRYLALYPSGTRSDQTGTVKAVLKLIEGDENPHTLLELESLGVSDRGNFYFYLKSPELNQYLGWTSIFGMYLQDTAIGGVVLNLQNLGRIGYGVFINETNSRTGKLQTSVLTYLAVEPDKNTVNVTKALDRSIRPSDLGKEVQFIANTTLIASWDRLPEKQRCLPQETSTDWADRTVVHCSLIWPSGRAGHSFSIFGDLIYLFGGYRTLFPYPYSNSEGSKEAIGGGFTEKYAPTPSTPNYLRDLWIYDLKSGFWAQSFPLHGRMPGERAGHSVVISGKMLMLFGGYRSNYFYDDMWQYNTELNVWNEKKTFTHAQFPAECTPDDGTTSTWALMDSADEEEFETRQCVALGGTTVASETQTLHMTTDALSNLPRCIFPAVYMGKLYSRCIPGTDDTRPPSEPGVRASIYPGVHSWCITSGPPLNIEGSNKGVSWESGASTWGYCHCFQCDQWDDGRFPCCQKDPDMPGFVAPVMECCPQNAGKKACDNELELEQCWPDYCYAGSNDRDSSLVNMSVWGQPTRGTTLDGQEGRLNGVQLFLHQPRRQAPGWDGCRDRIDGREDLAAKLMYERPSQRWNHRSYYSKDHDLMVTFGGTAYIRPTLADNADSGEYIIDDQMWVYDINKCPNDCNEQGACSYGYCNCFDGFYGLDCSNITCPGDFCYWDESESRQICTHCCFAGYEHLTDEEWVSEHGDSPKYLFWGDRKVPCSHTESGISKGICDGFGHCQCEPPYVGDDCSIVDCKNACSGHGECILEYPYSRCSCDTMFAGEDCSKSICYNNCSFPNGNCIEETGLCNCSYIMNPYNNTQKFAQWAGMDDGRKNDCSYVTVFAASCRPSTGVLVSLAAILVFFSSSLTASA